MVLLSSRIRATGRKVCELDSLQRLIGQALGNTYLEL